MARDAIDQLGGASTLRRETLTRLAERLRPRRLLAQWEGEAPKAGEYLMTEKGRTAKYILEVRPYQGTIRHAGRPFDYVIIYRAFSIEEIPGGATVHCFRYFPRHRRRAWPA